MPRICSNCHQEVADQARFCYKCGSPITYAPASQGYQQAQQEYHQSRQYPQQPLYQISQQKDYSSLGGWLLFFVILQFFSIASVITSLIKALPKFIPDLVFHPGTYEVLIAIAYMFSFFVIPLYITALVLILQRNPLFLRVFQWTAMIAFIGNLLQISALMSLLAYARFHHIAPLMIGQITTTFSGLAGLLLMTLYYCKSIRVRTYMGNDEYMNKAVFSFKQPPLQPQAHYPHAPYAYHPQAQPQYHSYPSGPRS